MTDYLFSWRFLAPLLFAAALPTGDVSPACASPLRVQFDVAPIAVCRDITTPEFAAAYPNERLLEAVLEVSTLLSGGGEGDFDEFFFRFTSPGQKLRFADYSPKTTLASEYAGNINVEEKNESSKSAGVTVSGVWDHLIKIAGSGDLASKDHLAVRYELHSPMEPITASGTIARGTGVYFKLRPSRQTALEGSRSFGFVLRAPAEWRGDYLQLHCEARGTRRGVVRSFDEPARRGVRDFFVALYLAGDAKAKATAETMVQAEMALQNALARYRQTLAERSSNASMLGQLASVWAPRPPRAASLAQIEQLIFSHSGSADSIPVEIPASLGSALEAYLAARTNLRQVSR